MRETIRKNDYFVLISCFLLGILAEITFFQVEIGLSMLLFISCFYIVFFLRFRLSAFHHRRIGILLMIIIWMLSATYLLFGETIFYSWNKMMIPMLMFIHIIVVTRPNTFVWGTTKFIRTMGEKLIEVVQYDFQLILRFSKFLRQKKIIILISSIVFILLCFMIYMNWFMPFLRVMMINIFIFGIFQVLRYPKNDEQQYLVVLQKKKPLHYKPMFIVSIILNVIGIVLYTGVTLEAVPMFYMTFLWTACTLFFFYIALGRIRSIHILLNISYSFLIVINSLFLYKSMQVAVDTYASAWTIRSFTAYLSLFYIAFLLMYTLIRIWASRISLTHFYFIIGIIFYTMLNVIHLEQFVANEYNKKNINGNEVNVQQLSYPGWIRLMEIYDYNEHDAIDKFLAEQYEQEKNVTHLFAYNFLREQFVEQYHAWINEKG
ncbi:hypothetical protein [Pseudogracilibacillus sp. ICA-222130]|uniref:hypothetical protein n=1 Tax=Pseudogracilibacillus sp. ICA-222130 TaxID=3134655 RepID=UPI0030C56D28